MLTNHSRPDSAMTAHLPTHTLSMLLAELGREAWQISERERAVRGEIEALYEVEENNSLGDWAA